MRKKEFLEELEEYLVGIPREEKEEIIQDYEEHFKIGKKKNRSEADIVKSLGDPKEIAREMRRTSSSKKPELKSEALETWVSVKRFTKHLFSDAEEKIGNVINKDKKKKDRIWPKIILGGLVIIVLILLLNSWLFKLLALIIIGVFIFNYLKNEDFGNISHKTKRVKGKKISKKQKKYRGTSTLAIISSLVFNLLFFIWLWLGIFVVVLSLFIVGLALIVSGAVILAFSIFALITHSTPITKDILLSTLFSSIGILILGGLLTDLFTWTIKQYFRITRAYIELNSRFIRK
jgi:uncharacterized membrane protein